MYSYFMESIFIVEWPVGNAKGFLSGAFIEKRTEHWSFTCIGVVPLDMIRFLENKKIERVIAGIDVRLAV